MKRLPKITETEWEIMRVVWAHHPITASQIIKRLRAGDASWHPKTTRALLNRLVQKGVLDYEPYGRSYVYEPLFTEQQCIAAASDSFLERVFGGSLKPMLAFFIEQRRISPQDIKELRSLLEEKTPKRAKER